MKPVTYHLTEAQHSGLKVLSVETGLPVAEIIRRAVDAHLSWAADERRRRELQMKQEQRRSGP